MFFKFEAEKQCIAQLDNHRLVRKVDYYKQSLFFFGVFLFFLQFFSPLIRLGLEYLLSFGPILHILPIQIEGIAGLFLMYHIFKSGRLYNYAMTELKSRL